MYADTIAINSVNYNKIRNFGSSSQFKRVTNTAASAKDFMLSHSTDKKGLTRSLAQIKLTELDAAKTELVVVNLSFTRMDLRSVITDAEALGLITDMVSFINDSTTQAKFLAKEV